MSVQVPSPMMRSDRRLARKLCLNRQDCEDLRQEFILALLKAGNGFAPSRSRPTTFITAVLNRRYKHYVRQFFVRNRLAALKPMRLDEVDDEVDQILADPRQEQDLRRADLRADVQVVLSKMPPKPRPICRLPMTCSPHEASKRLGVAPPTVTGAIPRIRGYFLEAGFEGACSGVQDLLHEGTVAWNPKAAVLESSSRPDWL
jgi:RNA polymerase sigma factor (sigma-70 family)